MLLLKVFEMVENQSASFRLKQIFIFNFRCLGDANPVKITIKKKVPSSDDSKDEDANELLAHKKTHPFRLL